MGQEQNRDVLGPPESRYQEGSRCARDLLEEALLKDKGIPKEG